jgi:outer membrane protein
VGPILWVGFLATAWADVPAVSLEEAIAGARANAANVRLARAQALAAEAKTAQARAAELPSVGLSGNALVYTAPYTVELPGSGELPVRDQVTWSFSASAVEPLTGQVALARQARAAELAEAASDAAVESALADSEESVEDVWYQALQAETQLDIAQTQVAALDARVATAQTSFQAGNLTESDRLLAQVALAQAKQSVIQIESVRDTAYARLGGAMGNGGTPVRPASSAAEPPPREPPPADTLVAWALASRPELAVARAQTAAAQKAADAASWARLPQINAVAAYVHNEGVVFAEEDSAYVGATLDWKLFAWGARNQQLKAIRAQVTQAQVQTEAAETQARVEVQAKVLALRAARAAYEVSAASIAQAEASLRAQEKRQAAGASTMSDLLDAQSALVRAQSTRATALYDARRAEVALARAVGRDPWGAEGVP